MGSYDDSWAFRINAAMTHSSSKKRNDAFFLSPVLFILVLVCLPFPPPSTCWSIIKTLVRIFVYNPAEVFLTQLYELLYENNRSC